MRCAYSASKSGQPSGDGIADGLQSLKLGTPDKHKNKALLQEAVRAFMAACAGVA